MLMSTAAIFFQKEWEDAISGGNNLAEKKENELVPASHSQDYAY